MVEAEKGIRAEELYALRLAGNSVASCASYFQAAERTVYTWMQSDEYDQLTGAIEEAMMARSTAFHNKVFDQLEKLLAEADGADLNDKLRIMSVIARFMG